MLKLIEAEEKYLKDYCEAYELSVKKIKEKEINEHDLMFMNPKQVNIIEQMKNINNGKNDSITIYNYFAVDNEKLIGIIQIRTNLTKDLLKNGGNIGYAVNPKYWKKGYGTNILKLGLKKAKELGIRKILISCDYENIGSTKIIEKNGGILDSIIEVIEDNEKYLIRRYYINLF